MTEEEMKTKWCPHSLVNNGSGHVGNKYWNGDKSSSFFTQSMCIASACSQWRWKKVHNPKWNGQQTYMAISPMLNPYSQEPSGIDSSTDGYCGLAGQP